MRHPTRQHFVVLSEDEKHPMKPWLRENLEYLPEGMHPDTHTSQQLRNGLRRNGWEVEEDSEVRVIFPAEDDPEAVIELLQEAKSLITPFGKWIQGTDARTTSGKSVDSCDPAATKFCLVGALIRARVNLGASVTSYKRARDIVCDEIHALIKGVRAPMPRNTNSELELAYFLMLLVYNDAEGRRQNDVVDVLDDAIFYLEEIEPFERSLSEFEATAEQGADYVSSHTPKQHHLDYRSECHPRRRHC